MLNNDETERSGLGRSGKLQLSRYKLFCLHHLRCQKIYLGNHAVYIGPILFIVRSVHSLAQFGQRHLHVLKNIVLSNFDLRYWPLILTSELHLKQKVILI